MTDILCIRAFDKTGALKDHAVPASSMNGEVWLEPLPGASSIHVFLKNGALELRAEVEVNTEGPIGLQIAWNQQRIVRLSSESRTVLTLPADQRYEPAPALRPARDSGKLDLFFLIDGTTRMASVEESRPVLKPLLGPDGSGEWNQIVQKLLQLVAEMAKQHADLRTGVMAFGDDSMQFISSAPDLACRYVVYPENAEERKLSSYFPEQLKQQLMRLPPTSGGDFVDALGEGMGQCAHVGWRAKARRVLVVCGDSPGFSLLRPAPPGADIHARKVDVGEEALRLHARSQVEIASLYMGAPASLKNNPYRIAKPEPFLDYARGQYRRLASLPALFWDIATFDSRAAAAALQAVPPIIGRGASYGFLVSGPT